MSEWIKCSDRLPDLSTKKWPSVHCIVATEHTITTAFFREDTVRKKKVKRWHGAYGLFNGKITHWMPLPEPPKE